MKGLTEIDATRIVLMKVGGRPAAFSWNLLLEGNVYLHRLAFDPAFSRFSPGIVTALDSLQLAAEEGAVRAEFLGGAERHKVELADGFEPLHLGLGLAGSARGRVALAARAEVASAPSPRQELGARAEGLLQVRLSAPPADAAAGRAAADRRPAAPRLTWAGASRASAPRCPHR